MLTSVDESSLKERAQKKNTDGTDMEKRIQGEIEIYV